MRLGSYIAIIFFVVVSALLLRFYRLMDFTDWSGDSGRDMLVARHLAEFKELKYVRPLCAGGAKIGLVNSPLYFYLLAAVWYLVESPEGMVVFFVCLGIASVALAGHTGLIIKNLRFGFFWSLYLAVGYVFIYYSRNVVQPHPLLFLTTLTIWLYAQLIQNKDKAFIYVATIITVLFIATHIHLSFLGLLIIWSLVIFGDAVIHHWFSVKRLIVLGIYYLIQLVILMKAILPEIHFPKDESKLFTSTQIIDHFLVTIKNALTYWLSFESKLSLIVLVILSIGGLFVLILRLKAEQSIFKRTYVFVFFGCIGYLLLAAFQMSDLYIFHFVPLHTTIAALIAGALSAVPTNKTKLNKLLQLSCICIGLLVTIPQFERDLVFIQPTDSQYSLYSQISKDICFDINNHKQHLDPNIYVFTGEHYDYYTGHIWMLLEKYCDQRFTMISNTSDSFLPLNEDFNTAYMTCLGNSDQDVEWCKYNFLYTHPQYFQWHENEVAEYAQLHSRVKLYKYCRDPLYTKTAP